ncbi:unnamed protein product [Prorocentrum cordatum]|uniref:Uncharacterized protein n=1 Tax=Prorocentrum cordatum TaxID=2364126 RepID=A0ABN9TMF3_9DINO|nr:unnamed protein product [Polarella glacialis]
MLQATGQGKQHQRDDREDEKEEEEDEEECRYHCRRIMAEVCTASGMREGLPENFTSRSRESSPVKICSSPSA